MPHERPTAATDARPAPPCVVAAQPAPRSRLAAFERSAIIGITLLVSASLALQSLVTAHGHVVGDARGAAVAASAATALPAAGRLVLEPALERPTTDQPRLSALARLQAMAARLDSHAIGPRNDSDARGQLESSPARAATAETGLRSDTFGPEMERKPKLRLASLGSMPSGTAGHATTTAARHPAANQAVLVVRPGDRDIVVKDGFVKEVAPKPRILGRDSSTARVEKVHFQAHTPERCLPHDLLDVIYDVAERFGEVQILSTFRDQERNRRVGGAEQSYHLSCQAIDFRVEGRQAGLLSYLQNRPEVGGLKRYPMGYFHIDNGPRRSW